MGRYDTDACNIDNSFTEPNSLKIQHLKKKGGVVLYWFGPKHQTENSDMKISK